MEASTENSFVIARTFNAPPAQVFAMWTQPEELARWLAPPGFSMQFVRADIRPGGSTLFTMTGYGMTMTARADYEAIDGPERIVYTQQFCDEQEHVTRHPMAPTWPETVRISVALREDGPGRTHVTATTAIAGTATDAETATFVAGHSGMTMGWTNAFDQLAAALAKP